MMVLIGPTRRHVLRTRYELRRIGYRWWQSEIVSMDMAKRKNHLHRQRKQRQLRARSKSRSEPFHYFKPPFAFLPTDSRSRKSSHRSADGAVNVSGLIASLIRQPNQCGTVLDKVSSSPFPKKEHF